MTDFNNLPPGLVLVEFLTTHSIAAPPFSGGYDPGDLCGVLPEMRGDLVARGIARDGTYVPPPAPPATILVRFQKDYILGEFGPLWHQYLAGDVVGLLQPTVADLVAQGIVTEVAS